MAEKGKRRLAPHSKDSARFGARDVFNGVASFGRLDGLSGGVPRSVWSAARAAAFVFSLSSSLE